MDSFYNPVNIIWGSGSINNLSDIITDNKLEMNRILVLTGRKSLKQSGALDIIFEHLTEKEIYIFNKIDSNPEIVDLFSIKTETDNINYDSIIAIGGGSVMDIAKCLSAFKNLEVPNSNILESYIKNKDYKGHVINTPIIAIPTTAGTGSEVTSWATIWDKSNNKKYSVEDKRIYAKVAVIDPKLTINLPLSLTTSTALDAVSHALEAYWSKKSNEIVRLYALKSIELIIKNINLLLDNLSDMNLRGKVALGSMYAGLAFSNTRTTACHSISYPLTAMYNIPHGVATSMTLAKFLDINKDFLYDKESLLNVFGAEKISDVETIINNIFKKSKIAVNLRDYGIKKEDIDSIVKGSFTPGRIDNNPVDINEDTLKRVLKSIY